MSLADEVAAREWYHTFELAPGLETPGWFDLRGLPSQLPIPESLAGKRCLDVGTFDGFWAFELERRGADEVVAVDVLDPVNWDWPAGSSEAVRAAIGRRKSRGEGFEIAARELGSSVVRFEKSVYELDPAVDGTFDFIYLGSLLLHLRDPVGALAKVRAVCSGSMLTVDAVDLAISVRHPRRPVAGLDAQGRPWWWRPNDAALRRMVEAAGWSVVSGPSRVWMRSGRGQPVRPKNPRLLGSRSGREQLLVSWRGDPHAAVLAVPSGEE